MHIGTADNRLPSTGGFVWWTQGRVGRWIRRAREHEPRDVADVGYYVRSSIIRATLRDIREPLRSITVQDLIYRKPEARKAKYVLHKMLHERCIRKYGAGSEQARLTALARREDLPEQVSTEKELRDRIRLRTQSEEERERGRMWAPTFEQIMELPRSDR